MRISDWSSDVCSSDLVDRRVLFEVGVAVALLQQHLAILHHHDHGAGDVAGSQRIGHEAVQPGFGVGLGQRGRSEEHTSELQSLMRISYAVLSLKQKNSSHNSATSIPSSA